jgi:opacity protein-like surface antigen
VFGGWSMPTGDHDFFYSGGASSTATSAEAQVDLENGFMAGLAIGAQVNEWLRAEVEVSGHWHEAEGSALLGFITTVPGSTPSAPPVSTPATSSANLDGDGTAMFVLANAWFELPVGEAIRPYVGGGVGIGRLDVDLETSGGVSVINDSDWAFAYQVGAGFAFGITPGAAIDIGYRYKVINNAELEATAPSGAGFDVETDYKSHNVLVGVRIGF